AYVGGSSEEIAACSVAWDGCGSDTTRRSRSPAFGPAFGELQSKQHNSSAPVVRLVWVGQDAVNDPRQLCLVERPPALCDVHLPQLPGDGVRGPPPGARSLPA